MIEFWIGVDGGGSGTRAQWARRDGVVRGRGRAGPSALGQGRAAAWVEIQRAVAQAFADGGLSHVDPARCALGLGLSGVNQPVWRAEFLSLQAASPAAAFGRIELFTDALAMLVGAHAGRPGAMVAAGTGSVGEALDRHGAQTSVGGWGFPVGDEGSGAWLGLHAVRLAQAALDGRSVAGTLARSVWDACGGTRDPLLAWCGQAGQFAYAQLAPLVFEAEASDPAAAELLRRAASALEDIARALDPQQQLPLVLCGSIGERLAPRFSPAAQGRLVASAGDATDGALHLVRRSVSPEA